MPLLKGVPLPNGYKPWHVALMVGVPVSVVGGIYLYRRYSKSSCQSSSLPLKPESEAKKFKVQGNEHFKAGRYSSAIDCYTKAIEMQSSDEKNELSTYYQNRAAAYDQMKNYLMVVKDCTQAVSLNPKYIKALNRRAKAYKSTGFLKEALEDITSVCVLEGFSDAKSVQLADSIVKEICDIKAEEKMKVRQPRDPSSHQISRLLLSFSQDPVFNSFEYKNLSSATSLPHQFNRSSYKRALLAFMNQDFSNFVELCDEEMKNSQLVDEKGECLNKVYKNKDNSDSGLVEGFNEPTKDEAKMNGKDEDDDGIDVKDDNETSIPNIDGNDIPQECNKNYRLEAQNLKGTYYYLSLNRKKALETFDAIINDESSSRQMKCNSLLKRAKVHCSEDHTQAALNDYTSAEAIDPSNPDVFLHRGQFHLLNEKLEEAVRDFEKSIELNSSCPEPHILKAFTQSRKVLLMGDLAGIGAVIDDFKNIINKFPNYAEAYIFYGQILQNIQKFDEADENFQKALKIDANCSNAYVHRGVLMITWRNDMLGGLELMKKAIQVDPSNAFAYQALGTILFQKGDTKEGIENIEKALEYVSLKTEISHLYTVIEATQVQTRVASRLGVNLSTALA